MAVLASAEFARREGRLEDAAAAARRSLELSRRGGSCLDTALAHLMVAGLGAGSAHDARAHLDQARRIVAGCPDPGVVPGFVREVEALLRLGAASGPAHTITPAQPLTPREGNVLRLLHSDLSLREIAAELFVSYYTVKSQTRAIYRKLGVSTRAEAVSRSTADG
jgi:LuxR family transcriptional regulator, maltose regulon positive regulatory protein